jgi:SnoaL-like domain
MDDDAVAYLAIIRLQARYADIATRRAWAEMSDVALDDARFSFALATGQSLELVGPAALAALGAQATAQFSFYEYIPLNTVVTVTSDTTATGTFYSLEVGVDAGNGEWTEFYGRYEDAYATDRGRWLFARREFRVLTSRVRSAP